VTTYDPASLTLTAPPDEAAAVPTGPKLAYEIGEKCWIFAGIRDQRGNHIYSAGKVVYWFDLPDMAQRFYVIRVSDPEFMHLVTRDATVMSPTATGQFPFQRTRFDEISRPEPRPVDWRTS
jgi:hypothetical protein